MVFWNIKQKFSQEICQNCVIVLLQVFFELFEISNLFFGMIMISPVNSA